MGVEGQLRFHCQLWQDMNGLPQGNDHIHHRDGHPENNRLENLQKLNRQDHRKMYLDFSHLP